MFPCVKYWFLLHVCYVLIVFAAMFIFQSTDIFLILFFLNMKEISSRVAYIPHIGYLYP